MSIDSRIRELKRAILHEKNKQVRKIYKEHIEFLKLKFNKKFVYKRKKGIPKMVHHTITS
jgi:hypothetical protein